MRYRFEVVDLRDMRDVPCIEPASIDDSWHPSSACDVRIRALLDVAARQER